MSLSMKNLINSKSKKEIENFIWAKLQRRQWQPTPVLLPVDGGAWWAAVLGVSKSWTWLRDFTFTFHFHALEKEMATHSSVLAWRIPGTGEPGGLPSMGSHRVGHDWSDLAAAARNIDQKRFVLDFIYPLLHNHTYTDLPTYLFGTVLKALQEAVSQTTASACCCCC